MLDDESCALLCVGHIHGELYDRTYVVSMGRVSLHNKMLTQHARDKSKEHSQTHTENLTCTMLAVMFSTLLTHGDPHASTVCSQRTSALTRSTT